MGSRPLSIVGLGDSTTAGTPGFLSPLEAPPEGKGDPKSQYAYWMRCTRPRWTVLNRGINGQTSAEIRARFDRDVVSISPDYVIILAGVNDIYAGLEPEAVERNLAPIYAWALDKRIVPVAATVLPYTLATHRASDAIRVLNDWIVSFARALQIPMCDTAAAVADPSEPWRLRGSPDGLHPDVDGYRRMGEALVRTIEGHLRDTNSELI